MLHQCIAAQGPVTCHVTPVHSGPGVSNTSWCARPSWYWLGNIVSDGLTVLLLAFRPSRHVVILSSCCSFSAPAAISYCHVARFKPQSSYSHFACFPPQPQCRYIVMLLAFRPISHVVLLLAFRLSRHDVILLAFRTIRHVDMLLAFRPRSNVVMLLDLATAVMS